ncbi:hypothetical protein DO72_4918 [Burkholderia pseudomallei]|nr:hypothetical protein DO72_4918 [Burkholderia pseudomallei]
MLHQDSTSHLRRRSRASHCVRQAWSRDANESDQDRPTSFPPSQLIRNS